MRWCLMRTERNDMQVCFTSRRRRDRPVSVLPGALIYCTLYVAHVRPASSIYSLWTGVPPYRTDVVTMRNKWRRSVLGPKYVYVFKRVTRVLLAWGGVSSRCMRSTVRRWGPRSTSSLARLCLLHTPTGWCMRC